MLFPSCDSFGFKGLKISSRARLCIHFGAEGVLEITDPFKLGLHGVRLPYNNNNVEAQDTGSCTKDGY